VEPMAGLEPAT